ncbi:MAG: hypothetical protein ABI255_04260 [Microbacteriaceae bacterium]
MKSVTPSCAPALFRVALLGLVGFGLVACSAAGSGPSTGSPSGSAEPTGSAAPEPSASEGAGTQNAQPTQPEGDDRFSLSCSFPDGRSAGEFSSLKAAWASTNFVRFDYCVASYVGPQPFTLDATEASVAEVAAAQLPDEPETELYLRALATCARVAPGDGPRGVASYPKPILEAALQLCPKAPQAGIIERYLNGEE